MSLPGNLVEVAGTRVFVHRPAPPTAKDPRRGTVVLVHGYLVSHWEWRFVAGPLADAGFDVIAFDHPGHGESDRPRDYRYGIPAFSETLIGLLDALEIERAALVGHSMGGAVSIYTAAKRPERITRLGLVDSACYPVRMPADARLALTPFIGAALFKTVFGKRDIRNYFRTQVYRDPAMCTDETVDYIYERFCRPGGKEAAHATMGALTDLSEVERSVRAIRAPTLCIWGEEDKLFPLSEGKRLASEIAGATLTVIPACGHACNEERPRQLVDILTPFLSEATNSDTARASAG